MSESLLAKYPFPIAAPRVSGDADGASPVSAFQPRTGEVLLTPGQKQALLVMRKSETSRAVLEQLRALGQLATGGADYYALAGLGLAINKGAFHVLSPNGRWRADNIAIAYARELKLHLLTFNHGGPGRAAYVRCTCGFVAYRSRHIPSYAIGLGRDGAYHLAHVGASK